MGAIGKPKREIYIPVPPLEDPLPSEEPFPVGAPEPAREPVPTGA
jgi:hypothetical protein